MTQLCCFEYFSNPLFRPFCDIQYYDTYNLKSFFEICYLLLYRFKYVKKSLSILNYVVRESLYQVLLPTKKSVSHLSAMLNVTLVSFQNTTTKFAFLMFRLNVSCNPSVKITVLTFLCFPIKLNITSLIQALLYSIVVSSRNNNVELFIQNIYFSRKELEQ